MSLPREFLASIVDYAGLFPPAELSMADSVREYARVRAGPESWALGRFVVPAARLGDFELAARPFGGKDWELSVLVDRKIDFPGLRVGALETKASAAEDLWTAGVPVFFEIPVGAVGLLPAVARVGGRAKVRTGGSSVPSSSELARFLAACREARVAFKATAGLHHPLRHGREHGFLNLFLAAALVRDGGGEAEAVGLLDESSRAAFAFDGTSASWRGRRIPLADVRRDFALSFGSCSFQEPMDGLRELGFL